MVNCETKLRSISAVSDSSVLVKGDITIHNQDEEWVQFRYNHKPI